MSGQWKEVVTLLFKGERFRDHALDLTALSELRQFQKMVAETAKALWRKANPDRERLPPHFEDRTRLCLRRIDEGSAAAPLEVFIEESEQPELWVPEPVEVNEAVEMTYQVFQAARNDTSLPDEFPKELLAEYAKWGQSLSDEEHLEFAPPSKSAATVTQRERERLTAFAETSHEDEVNIVGEVLAADVRQKRFQLSLDDRLNVQISFTADQEDAVTTALKDHRTMRLRVHGRGEYDPQGKLLRIVTVDELALCRDRAVEFDAEAPAIEDVLTELANDVPEEEWDNLPPDLTDKLDHYLYGGTDG